ncbi:peptidoglycan-binding protein [uncultured Cohaesibacter sp.]|uniref:peptidoglycan-binding protein n=1 Tax=uncultured Cohaesibacter sp. TaxID=1002546 RepID=UPI00292E2FEF|nr:peptidoglycan-binding protein [uncultured Cohaesibacter sp.]
MHRTVSLKVCALMLMTAIAIPVHSNSAKAGSNTGAFAAGAIIGGVVGAIAASQKGRTTQKKRTTSYSKRKTSNSAAYSAQRQENIQVQKALNLYGFNVGTADGALGKKSKAGIRQFQMANGFAPTGQLTQVEKQMLLTVPFQVENALYQNGFSVGMVDGKVDQQTSIAIAQFQGKLGETPTGSLTPNQTLRLLGDQQTVMASQQGYVPNQMQPTNTVQTIVPAASNTQIISNAGSSFPEIVANNFAKGKIKNDNAVAVIIGNQDYSGKDIPNVEFATRDALAMKYAFINTLGIPEDNVIYIENATLSVLVDTFGNESPDGSMLWSYIDPDGESDVYVYYSGHGIPSLDNGGAQAQAYIAPTDVISTSSIQSSYSLEKLYSNLEALPTKSVTLFIDACFSGAAGNGDMIIQAASPIVIPAYAPEESGSINVFAAAQADQIASWDESDGHGIFTKYLIAGLGGQADGDDDGSVSNGELEAFLEKQVHRSARRSWRRDQTPTFEGDQEQVIVYY